ncbi:phosphoglycolate phosphatase [Caminibacter sp.]
MKAVFFDLDGTIIDSSGDLANSINYMLKQLGKKGCPIELIKTWIGNGASVLVKRALSGGMEIKAIDENLFKKAKEIFLNHYKNNLTTSTILYPKVKETLLKIPHKKAIITNKPEEFVRPILKHLDIEMFDLILGGESLPEKKPSPLPLLYACKNFGISPDEALMIGDSANDILAAKKAGIKIIALNYGYNQGENISKHNPDFIFNKFSDILKVING